jgi:hypothetical protein
MEIAGVSSAISTLNQASPTSLVGQVSLKMLDKSLEAGEQAGTDMIRMMENSVTPYLGGNFDMSI